MGVPSFYRWLVNKYPKIVVNAKEEKGGEGIVIDTSQSNPNGMEFDNLYLDLNGIIHPCFHPDDNQFPPTTYDEVFNGIFEQINRLFSIVRPRKLLYLAIDGVAPRAKMNQQRCRRFQTAKQEQQAEAEEEQLRREFELLGKIVLPKQEYEVSDSNVITPGTEFMDKLSKALKKYICLNLKNDPGWQDIKVILSDANVPGEGEHKIMEFIRLQRNRDGYNPNTRHCIYGKDADLIILALATHEVHLSILREDVAVSEQQPSCTLSLENSLLRQNAYSVRSKPWFPDVLLDNRVASTAKTPYQFLNIWTLREYLELDMTIPDSPKDFVINIERTIDDFIFMCFFTGNDFLPRLPTLEIHEGAIDLLMAVYKSEFKRIGGYLVDTCRLKEKHCAYIKFKRVEKLILAAGSYEDQIFKKRSLLRQRKLEGILRRKLEAMGDDDMNDVQEDFNCQSGSFLLESHTGAGYCAMRNVVSTISHSKTSNASSKMISLEPNLKCYSTEDSDVYQSAHLESHTSWFLQFIPKSLNHSAIACLLVLLTHISMWKYIFFKAIVVTRVYMILYLGFQILNNTRELKQKLKELLQQKSDLFKNGSLCTDKVKLGSEGCKNRYYRSKFSLEKPEEIEIMRRELVQNYAEGLCWVLRYYFEGVCSWSWYYKYHYGPFASDFKGLSGCQAKFQLGMPFKPLSQLMAVLPPRSAHAVPEAYRSLMTCLDSNIIDLYPTDFEVDSDGKRYLWQCVTMLEFIDEKRLLPEIEKLESKLKENEVRRNAVSLDMIFVRANHDFGSQVSSLCCHCVPASGDLQTSNEVTINWQKSGGLNGFLRSCEEYSRIDTSISAVKGTACVVQNDVICALFKNPSFQCHIPEPPKTVEMPEKIVTEKDIEKTPLWHEHKDSQQRVNRFQTQQRYTRKAGNGGTSKSSEWGSYQRGEGSSWGSRRGRGSSKISNFSQNSEKMTGRFLQARNGGFAQPQNGLLANGSGNKKLQSPQEISSPQGLGRANMLLGNDFEAQRSGSWNFNAQQDISYIPGQGRPNMLLGNGFEAQRSGSWNFNPHQDISYIPGRGRGNMPLRNGLPAHGSRSLKYNRSRGISYPQGRGRGNMTSGNLISESMIGTLSTTNSSRADRSNGWKSNAEPSAALNYAWRRRDGLVIPENGS